MCGGQSTKVGGDRINLREIFFSLILFRKNASKYPKVIAEPYICDNLNKIYQLFSILT